MTPISRIYIPIAITVQAIKTAKETAITGCVRTYQKAITNSARYSMPMTIPMIREAIKDRRTDLAFCDCTSCNRRRFSYSDFSSFASYAFQSC